MNLHRRWASRRAWQIRALLATLLAAAAWLLRGWLGYPALVLPLAALLYPSRRQEARALAEIDRSLGLAYRTALETRPGEPAYERLRQEAERVEKTAVLPRFPWPALLLAAGVWLAAGLLPPPQAAGQTTDRTAHQTQPAPEPNEQDGATRPDRPAGKPDAAKQESGQGTDRPARERTPAATEGGQKRATAEDAAVEAGDEMGEQTAAETTAAGAAESEQASPTAEGSREIATRNGASPAEAARDGTGREGMKTSETGERTTGEGKEKAGTGSAATPDQNGGPGGESGGGPGPGDDPAANARTPKTMPVPPPRAPAGLPSPWEGGAPPAEVQQAAERYIENNPLPPGAADALKRYFDLGD